MDQFPNVRHRSRHPKSDGSIEQMQVAVTRCAEFGPSRQSVLRSRPRYFAARFGGYLDCWSCEGQRSASFPLFCLRAAHTAKESDPWPSSRGCERETAALRRGCTSRNIAYVYVRTSQHCGSSTALGRKSARHPVITARRRSCDNLLTLALTSVEGRAYKPPIDAAPPRPLALARVFVSEAPH